MLGRSGADTYYLLVLLLVGLSDEEEEGAWVGAEWEEA